MLRIRTGVVGIPFVDMIDQNLDRAVFLAGSESAQRIAKVRAADRQSFIPQRSQHFKNIEGWSFKNFPSLPGLETTSGPLGEGLSQAIGISLAARLDNKKYYVYCITSDGEHEEGNTWEAAMFAGKNRINNLIQIIDRNNIQIDGFTEDIMPLEPLKEKYEAFNWEVLETDGNNIRTFIDTVREARAIVEKPVVIIAHTIPGMGVDFMEKDFHWHGKPPNKEEAKKALGELRTLQGKIQSEHE